jgi:hypothetical protein
MSAPRAVRGARPSRGEPNGRGARSVRWRSVALPIEHGAWGFLLEPALLGLLVAASWAGVTLVLAALAALLLQTPLSLALTDARRGKRYPRTALAWRFAAAYGLLLVAAGSAALALAGTAWMLLPVAIAAPLAGLQLWLDARGRARELLPEAAGAVAMGSLAASVALAGGWSLLPALGLWALLAARAVPAIVYVRARLRLERGEALDRRPSALLHLAAVAAVSLAAVFGAVSWVAAVPYAVLTARAARGLAPDRAPVTAKVVGFREIGFGVMTAVLVAAGTGAWG